MLIHKYGWMMMDGGVVLYRSCEDICQGKDEKVSMGVVDASPVRTGSLYNTTVDNDLPHSRDKWSPI